MANSDTQVVLAHLAVQGENGHPHIHIEITQIAATLI
jgi:hypothetical protein